MSSREEIKARKESYKKRIFENRRKRGDPLSPQDKKYIAEQEARRNEISISDGSNEFKGNIVDVGGTEKAITIRKVSEKELKIKENRLRLSVLPNSNKVYLNVLPVSDIKPGKFKQETALRSVLPEYSVVADTRKEKITLTAPKPEPVVSKIKRTQDNFGLGMGGEFRQFVPERDLQRPKFFGFTEPAFTKLRLLEHDLSMKAGTEDLKTLRNKSPGSVSGKGAFYHGLNIPVQIINRPLTSTAIIGGSLIGAGTLGGGYVTSGAIVVSSIQETKAGGSGSKTLGLLGFIGATAIAGAGLSSLKSEIFPQRNIKFDVYSKGKIAKDYTGISRKGSTFNGKLYKEVFTTSGRTTKRTINYGKNTIKIIERPGFQASKIFKKGKLIGEDFKYIDSGSSIKGSVLPKLTGRETLLYDPGKPGRSSRLMFEETTSGSFSSKQLKGSTQIKTDIKVGDVYKRTIKATDQTIKISGKDFRSLDFNKPQFVFDGKSKNLVDQVIIKGGQRIDIVAPRFLERSVFRRSAQGTVEIKDISLFQRIKPSPLGKKGSVSIGELTYKPVFSISRKTTPGLNIPIPKTTFISSGKSNPFTSLASIPIVSTSTISRSKIRLSQKQGSENKIKVVPVSILKQGNTPKINLNQLTGQIYTPKTKPVIELSFKQKPQQVILPKSDFKYSYDYRPPKTITPGLPIPKIVIPSPTGFGGGSGSYKLKKNKVVSKSQYRPSLEAVVFDVSGSIPKTITPFSLRPKKRRKKKK